MPRRAFSLTLGLAFLFFAAVTAGLILALPEESDPLAASFAAPPDSARPWVYWMWMDGNLTQEGITADLEAMKTAGIGGVVICEVSVGIPRGPVEFMSPEWRRLFDHVVREAERLGLEITLNAGPGWTGSGGPWVKPEDSMQHMVASAVEVVGPARVDARSSPAVRRPAFFGEDSIPPALRETVNEFYLDAAVLAFPTPADGPTIADIDEKALYIRAPYSSQLGVKPFFPAPAGFPAVPDGAAIDSSRIVDLSESSIPPRQSGLGCSARALDHHPLRPDEHRGQYPARARSRLGARMRQAGHGRSRRPFRRVRRAAAPGNRSAPDRREGRLDDDPHRQLGDGGAELDRRLSAMNFGGGADTTPGLIFPRTPAGSSGAWRSPSAFSGTCGKPPRSWSSKTMPSISKSSAGGTVSASPSSRTT